MSKTNFYYLFEDHTRYFSSTIPAMVPMFYHQFVKVFLNEDALTDTAFEKLWASINSSKIPYAERLLLAMTFDYAYCPEEKIPEAHRIFLNIPGWPLAEIIEQRLMYIPSQDTEGKCKGIIIAGNSVNDLYVEWDGSKNDMLISCFDLVEP